MRPTPALNRSNDRPVVPANVMIGEFGVNFAGWDRASDPYLRGFRQAIWGAAVGGSTGTAMSWWWENIHAENVYPLLTTVGGVLNRTGWGSGTWMPISFPTEEPPVVVGNPIPGGAPFNAQLPLSGGWGGMPLGAFAVTSPDVAGNAANYLNSFVHGASHAELKRPFRLSAWLTNSARLVMHVNSVSDAVQLRVRSDGSTLFSTNLPNLDGGYGVNNEYNLDIPVNLPTGRHLIEITNAGGDWVFLDWVRLEQVLPSAYTNDWLPKPEAVGVRGPRESLLYVVAPNAAFPGEATNTTLPLQQGQALTFTNWPAGKFFAEWYEPTNGVKRGFTQSTTTNGKLTLPLPDFREDLAGILYGPPSLTAVTFLPPTAFTFQLTSETGGRYEIQRAMDLTSWLTFAVLTNTSGTIQIQDTAATNSNATYRAVGVR